MKMYAKRNDGRKFDELRPMEAKVGVIKRATGSAMFKIGNTIAYAAVYGPRPVYPKFLQNKEKGILRCYYNMMAFSGSGDTIRPGPSRRSKEISLVTQKALLPAIDLKCFPGSTIDVFIELVQTDSGTRCAGICAAAMALADAGFVMKDLVSSIALGRIEDKIIVDATKEEEDYEEDGEKLATDIPVAILPGSGIHLQLDGKIQTHRFSEAIEAAKKACDKILELQERALKGEVVDEGKSKTNGGKK